MKLMKTKLIYE